MTNTLTQTDKTKNWSSSHRRHCSATAGQCLQRPQPESISPAQLGAKKFAESQGEELTTPLQWSVHRDPPAPVHLVVGMGGASYSSFGTDLAPTTEVRLQRHGYVRFSAINRTHLTVVFRANKQCYEVGSVRSGRFWHVQRPTNILVCPRLTGIPWYRGDGGLRSTGVPSRGPRPLPHRSKLHRPRRGAPGRRRMGVVHNRPCCRRLRCHICPRRHQCCSCREATRYCWLNSHVHAKFWRRCS